MFKKYLNIKIPRKTTIIRVIHLIILKYEYEHKTF